MSDSRHAVAAALQPGVVIGEPDDGLVNFVNDLRDIERGEVAGFNSRQYGGFRRLFPRLSKDDFEAVKVANLPEAEGVLETVIQSVPYLTQHDRKQYLLSRKMVLQTMGNGRQRLVMVPRAPEAASELDILRHEDEYGRGPSGLEVTEQDLASREKKRKYTLAQILTDGDVLPKYSLTMRAVETAKRVAATDPTLAARMFENMMNCSQTHTSVTVSSGDYSTNRVQAKNTIRQLCKGAERSDAAVHTLVMLDRFLMFGPGGESDWFVSGPLKYAPEVSFVYWMVRNEGCTMPSVLLSMELVLLRIDICDGESMAEPTLEYHASDKDTVMPFPGIATDTASLLSSTGRMAIQSMVDKLKPVIASDGRQLASAVRVTGKYVLVNSHVVEIDQNCTLDGNPVVVESQLSRDLWSVKNQGDFKPWILREPKVGEVVAVCYHNSGQVACSSPLKVTSVDASCVVTTKDDSVTLGMSGGALISLEDFALLGIHSASTLTNLLAYKFGPKQFSELLESDSVSTFSRYDDVDSFAAKAADHFRRRGLWSVFKSAAESLEPVYVDSQHIGMAVNNGEHLYTACDAEQALRIGPERRVAKFETVTYGGLYRTSSVKSNVSPVFRRAPNYFEKVFIVGFDEQPYMSLETTVTHIGPDSRSFIIRDLASRDKPVTGGLIMAWDGAILGCCGQRSMTTPVGLGFMCWPLHREESSANTLNPRAVLASAFPFLNIAAWTDSLIEEVFTHSSVARYQSEQKFNAGMKPLANIGDNKAKEELYKTLREFVVPHSQWAAIMQSLQSNSVLAKCAWDHGLAKLLVVGSGVVMQKDSKSYADMIEALIGAATTVETTEVVHQLCRSLGILYNTPTVETGFAVS